MQKVRDFVYSVVGMVLALLTILGLVVLFALTVPFLLVFVIMDMFGCAPDSDYGNACGEEEDE